MKGMPKTLYFRIVKFLATISILNISTCYGSVNTKLSATPQDALSNYTLGVRYTKGIEVERNLKKAAHYYSLSAKF